MRAITLSILAAFAFAGMLPAQAPVPVVVQAATPGVTSAQALTAPDNSSSLQTALRTLREMKTVNEETLRKQAAMLEQLDELEKAAEQIKIYSKRG